MTVGRADPRFGPLVDVVERYLDDGPFGGAALAVVRDGELVVDVWGGVADVTTGRPWAEDTLVLAYSVSKSVSTVVVLRLVEQGLLDLDAPVAAYWPEFAARGKDRVTLRQVMAHRAGIPLVDARLTFDEVLEGGPLVRAVADQEPLWEPGTGHSYHALTVGVVLGEVVRRVTGSTLGTVLRRDVAEPLGLDLWIGLPESEHARVATVMPADPRWMTPEDRARVAAVPADDPSVRAVTVDGAVPIPRAGASMASAWNDPRVWSAEVPAANAVGTARAFALLHAALVDEVSTPHGRVGPLLRPATLEDARRVQSSGAPAIDPVAPPPHNAWGTGFMVASDRRPLLGPSGVGHDGAAGAICFVDAESRTALAYLPSQFGPDPDPRPDAVVDALDACLR